MFLNKQKLGGIKDIPDARDLRYEEIAGAPDIALPDKTILNFNQSIKNQGNTSSCGCQASSLITGMQFNKELSARYAFNEIRTNIDYESFNLKWGQYTRDAAKVAVAGICNEELAPEKYTKSDTDYLSFDFTDDIRISADNNKAKSYIRVDGLFGNDFELVKRFINNEKKAVIICMPWFQSYNEAKTTGILPDPDGEQQGHIAACVGIDGDDYVMINSFGKDWGENGLFRCNRMRPTYDCWGVIVNEKIIKPEIKFTRNIELEKQKALEMQKELYKSFAPYDKARNVAGLEWLLIIQSICYRNYSYKDIINYCYAKSRSKDIPFNLETMRC